MKLSLILCSRNDEYMGNSKWRLETALNCLGHRLRRLGHERDVEVLVADWGSDIPLREVLTLQPAAADVVSFITVPPDVARVKEGDSPFPEVLALNAAARRARGDYIGRIDQDTIVGARFLRWFFDDVAAREEQRETTLWFANRRDIPYRLAVRCPDQRQVDRFVRWCGRVLPVRRNNAFYAHEYWTSSVGIWLAHRAIWEECRGYDERLIYYNWMETDMIRRLRPAHSLADLGELTRYDFYHLEHYHPRNLARTRSRKNPDIDRQSRPPLMRPNGHAWGLAECSLEVEPASHVVTPYERPGFAGVRDMVAFAGLMLRLVPEMLMDVIAMWAGHAATITRRRAAAATEGLAGQPMLLWPSTLWKLWHNRKVNRAR
jgi:hypothetical protein